MSRSTLELGSQHIAPITNSRRTLPFNLLAAGLGVGWLLLLSFTLSPNPDDFKQYWQAAVNVRATGDPFVPPPGQEATAHSGYYYPPVFAFLTQGIGLFGQLQGQVVWFVLNAVATVAFAALCIQLSGSVTARRYWGPVILGFLLMPPTRINLQLGQIGTFMGVLMLGSATLAARRPGISGLMLTLAVATRIFPVLLGFPLLFWGRLRTLLWCVVWGVGLLGVSVACYGVQPFLSFLQITREPPLPYPFAAEHNISFYGMFSRLFSATPYSASPGAELPWLVAPLTALCLLAVLAVCVWRGRAPDPRGEGPISLGLWLCGMMLVSPTNGTYTMVVLLAPLLAIMRRLELAPDRRFSLALAVFTALAMVPPGWTSSAPTLYLFAHTGWGLLLLTPALYGVIGYVALLAIMASRPVNDRQEVASHRLRHIGSTSTV